MIDNGFIKIHRKMINWEWYKDGATMRLFVHCLLMANWTPGRFMGYEIPRGSFATSYTNLSEQTGLTRKQVRTALKHLKRTQELAQTRTPKFSIITVVNYNIYQVEGTDEGTERAQQGHTKGTERAPIEEYKRKKERKNNNSLYARETGEDKQPYGIYNNVYLTPGEFEELLKQYPNDYIDMIENLSVYMRSKGRHYDDHFATMMKWKRDDKKAQTYDYRKDIKI